MDEEKIIEVASTEHYTHYAIHKSRGARAAKGIGILTDFKGTMIHDHWKPYYTFTECTHAECNAHHIRSLKGIHENYGHKWAQDMASLLVEIKRAADYLKVKGLNGFAENDIREYVARYNNIIAEGKKENAEKGSGAVLKKMGKPVKSNALRLLEKLEAYQR